MKTLHHTETTWQGRKIIIDAADLTADVYDDMLNCMPPYSLPRDMRRDGHKGFLMGEPTSSDAQGLLYMAFVRHGLQHFYYGLVHR